MNQSNIIGDDIISETDGSSDNRDEDKVNLLASNYCEILKVYILSASDYSSLPPSSLKTGNR
jgi:hypothetical protein